MNRLKKDDGGKELRLVQFNRKVRSWRLHALTEIVEECVKSNAILAIEDLAQEFCESFCMNRDLGQFYEVRCEICNLCRKHGIMLYAVDPRGTSKTCPSCEKSHAKSRKGESFKCVKCGYSRNADEVGAINIAGRDLGVPLNLTGQVF